MSSLSSCEKVMHQDSKPENILKSRYETIKIAGFEFTKFVGQFFKIFMLQVLWLYRIRNDR
jgi:serine/threonine protein kinase